MTDKSTIFLYEMLAMAFFSYGIISKENITLVFFIARLLCAPFTKGHLNPAATLAEFLLRNITLGETFVYWIGQLSGAFLGAFFNYLILGNLNAPEVDETQNLYVLLGSEILGTFIFILMIQLSQQSEGIARQLSITIGLAIGIGMAQPSGGCLNPGMAITHNIYKYWQFSIDINTIYVFVGGPFLGSILASIYYSWQNRMAKTIYE